MNRSSSKIRHIQKSNLILESRYLFEGNLTLTQILQGKQLLLFNRKDEENAGKNRQVHINYSLPIFKRITNFKL